MPTKRAAAGSPPNAKICLPDRVYASTNATTAKQRTAKVAPIGMPKHAPEGERVESLRHAADRHQGIEQRDALNNCGDRKRYDEGMNPQQQYQRPIDEADRKAYRQHCRNHWSGDVGIPVDYAGKQRGRQSDIGIEREIDASSQNNHCLPERYKCEAGCLLEYVDGIVKGTEAVTDRETNDKEQSRLRRLR